jgi:hypothetical protein
MANVTGADLRQLEKTISAMVTMGISQLGRVIIADSPYAKQRASEFRPPSVAAALRPNGLFVFTLEDAVGDGAGVDYRLELHGRYSYARSYVEQLLTFSGLQSKTIQAELRMEAGAPVPGVVICAANSVLSCA